MISSTDADPPLLLPSRIAGTGQPGGCTATKYWPAGALRNVKLTAPYGAISVSNSGLGDKIAAASSLASRVAPCSSAVKVTPSPVWNVISVALTVILEPSIEI